MKTASDTFLLQVFSSCLLQREKEILFDKSYRDETNISRDISS